MDGHDHTHALIVFKNKLNIRNSHYFDYEDYHPNILPVKNFAASINYVKKDGNFVCYGKPMDTKEADDQEVPYTSDSYEIN